jgi:hypothetical protein
MIFLRGVCGHEAGDSAFRRQKDRSTSLSVQGVKVKRASPVRRDRRDIDFILLAEETYSGDMQLPSKAQTLPHWPGRLRKNKIMQANGLALC